MHVSASPQPRVAGSIPSPGVGARHLVLDVADGSTVGAGCSDLVVEALRRRGVDAEAVQLRLADCDPLACVPEVVEQVTHLLVDGRRWRRTDVVHALGWLPTLGALAARQGLDGSPAVAAHLGNGPVPPTGTTAANQGAAAKVERLAWASGRSADVVVLDSRWAVERAVEQGVARSRIVQATAVAPPVDEPRGWSQHAGPARVLAVGGIGTAAGTPTLVRALAGLTDVQLVVAARADALEAQVQTAQNWVAELCRRWGAPVALVQPLTPELLDGVDLVVDAGIAPGRVGDLISAMAGRRAVVATGDGSKAEVVSPATTGELVEPGSWRQLRRRVGSVLEDPFKLESYGDAGLERYLAVHTPERRAVVAQEVAARVAVPV